MEVKIKQGSEMLDATIEMVDGVMVVSPKVEKFEPKDGDVITCTNSCCTYTLIVKSIRAALAFHYAVLIDSGMFKVGCSCDYSNTRPATEEEKQKLFDRLKEEGWEWDAEKKELVKLKWKPKLGDDYWRVDYNFFKFCCAGWTWKNSIYEIDAYNNEYVFRTYEECQAFCDRLNEAISSVKP